MRESMNTCSQSDALYDVEYEAGDGFAERQQRRADKTGGDDKKQGPVGPLVRGQPISKDTCQSFIGLSCILTWFCSSDQSRFSIAMKSF